MSGSWNAVRDVGARGASNVAVFLFRSGLAAQGQAVAAPGAEVAAMGPTSRTDPP